MGYKCAVCDVPSDRVPIGMQAGSKGPPKWRCLNCGAEIGSCTLGILSPYVDRHTSGAVYYNVDSLAAYEQMYSEDNNISDVTAKRSIAFVAKSGTQ
jgi:DNA-directed RNA polymerase subunit RPC12/RpoP